MALLLRPRRSAQEKLKALLERSRTTKFTPDSKTTCGRLSPAAAGQRPAR